MAEKMTRVTWSRQFSRTRFSAMDGDEKPVMQLHDLGTEMVCEEPCYDNGLFFVIDMVKNLEWAVFSWEYQRELRRTIDKYEAIRWADEFKEANNGA